LGDIIWEHCDLSSLAAPQGSVVVAEKIPRLPDINMAPRCRVDFFVYHPNGDVLRYHPFRKARGRKLEPHVMRNGCSLFLKAAAATYGVGEALHRMPPAWVEHLNSLAPPPGAFPKLAVRRPHMAEIFRYDMSQWGYWRPLELILGAIPEDMCPVDLTDGHYFPWWVWIAKELRENPAGITEIFMVIDDNGKRHVIFDGESGYRIKAFSSWATRKLVLITEAMYSALKG